MRSGDEDMHSDVDHFERPREDISRNDISTTMKTSKTLVLSAVILLMRNSLLFPKKAYKGIALGSIAISF